MKKIITYAAGLLITCSVAAAPGSKLIQAFKQTFPNAENVKWSDDKAGYFVSFYDHGNFEKIFYNKAGDFISSWKYTDGKNLPMNIVMAINKKYGESKVLGVTELTTQTDVVYAVQLSKDENLYSLQASPDGTILKEQKFDTPSNE